MSRRISSGAMPAVSAASVLARSGTSGPGPRMPAMNASRWAASASDAGGGARIDAICTALSPAVTSAYRSASFSLSRGSAMRATALRVARSGMGMSTTATLGFETIFGASSLRFSATSRMMLSPFSMAGSDDQRCSMMMAARSASAWNVGSPAGAIDSAYSRMTAARIEPTSSRSSAGSTLPFCVSPSSVVERRRRPPRAWRSAPRWPGCRRRWSRGCP